MNIVIVLAVLGLASGLAAPSDAQTNDVRVRVERLLDGPIIMPGLHGALDDD